MCRPHFALAFVLLLAVVGCSRTVEVSRVTVPPAPTVSVPAPSPPPPPPPAPEPSGTPEVQVGPQGRVEVQDLSKAPVRGGEQVVGSELAGPLKDVFFDYDDALIRPDQQESISADAAWLAAHPNVTVRVEGNCDERGTAEYNLALGQRRADAVRSALIATGVRPDRIATVSYGKERPFVLGHDESQWRWNRRAHLAIQ